MDDPEGPYAGTPFVGTPFVGIQTTTRDKIPDDIGIRTYCLLQPTNETEIGGMHGIPFDADPKHPWSRGLNGLAATVAQNYGSDYKEHVTFEPPQDQKIGSDEYGWCTQRYESLPDNELNDFHKAAEVWIRNHQE